MLERAGKGGRIWLRTCATKVTLKGRDPNLMTFLFHSRSEKAVEKQNR